MKSFMMIFVVLSFSMICMACDEGHPRPSGAVDTGRDAGGNADNGGDVGIEFPSFPDGFSETADVPDALVELSPVDEPFGVDFRPHSDCNEEVGDTSFGCIPCSGDADCSPGGGCCCVDGDAGNMYCGGFPSTCNDSGYCDFTHEVQIGR